LPNMEEGKFTVKSFWLYAFTTFISVNLIAMKQIFGVASISTNNALMPLMVAFLISIIQKCLVLLNTKESIWSEDVSSDSKEELQDQGKHLNPIGKLCRWARKFQHRVSLASPLKYHVAVVFFCTS